MEDLRKSSYENFPRASQKAPIQAPMQSIFKISMQGPLEEDFNGSPWDLLTRTCTRSYKDTCKDTERISPGALQDLPTRTCTRLYKIRLRPLTAFHYDLCKIFPHDCLKKHIYVYIMLTLYE